MRLLIDTVTFIWATGSPERISKVAATAMEPESVQVEVSAISPFRNPFDRHDHAQALSEDIPIVTSDDKFRLYKGLKVIW